MNRTAPISLILGKVQILPWLEFLEDKEKKLTIDDVVSMLKDDEQLQNAVELKLSKDDILWFNKNNDEIFILSIITSLLSNKWNLDCLAPYLVSLEIKS